MSLNQFISQVIQLNREKERLDRLNKCYDCKRKFLISYGLEKFNVDPKKFDELIKNFALKDMRSINSTISNLEQSIDKYRNENDTLFNNISMEMALNRKDPKNGDDIKAYTENQEKRALKRNNNDGRGAIENVSKRITRSSVKNK